MGTFETVEDTDLVKWKKSCVIKSLRKCSLEIRENFFCFRVISKKLNFSILHFSFFCPYYWT